jgi:hypothetical protein
MYRGKGDGSEGKKIPKSGAVKTVGQYKVHKRNGASSDEARKAANGDPRKKAR